MSRHTRRGPAEGGPAGPGPAEGGPAGPGPTIVPFGDAAVLVVLAGRVDPDINRRVHRLAATVRELAAGDPRFGRPVPGYASLLVPVDPLELGVDDATTRLAPLVDAVLAEPAPAAEVRPRRIELPTRYGGVDGPDLAEVAERHDLRPADVVELHASVNYVVYLLGFAPGFAYLGSVPAQIATPRRPTPRARVPAGSVGIADDQTAVYPFATPGGWQLIGRTEAPLWDLGRNPPALLAPGHVVRFVPVHA